MAVSRQKGTLATTSRPGPPNGRGNFFVLGSIPCAWPTDVECEDCGVVYTRVEVERMHTQPTVRQFQCSVCGHTLEAGLTRSIIGYRITMRPEGPFVDSPLT